MNPQHRDVCRRVRELSLPLVSYSCLWEATARKVGNVHPKASFADMTYLDFANSAVTIEAAFRRADTIGEIISDAVRATQRIVGKNTNLGMVLLLAPLASIPCDEYQPLCGDIQHLEYDLRNGIGTALANTTIHDSEQVYYAIRTAQPAGLGKVTEQDIQEQPTVTLKEVMSLASNHDLIARQYSNNYMDVFDLGVPALIAGFVKYGCLEAAIIHCQLAWMVAFPDSLIVRKNGLAVGEEVQRRVQHMQSLGGLATPEGRAAGVALDAHLRSNGNKLNPGTTADLVCACLFVALREGKIPLDAPFPWQVEDWL